MISNLLTHAHLWALNKRAELAAEDGQGTIEYMVVIGIIVVAIVGFVALADIQGLFDDLIGAVTGLSGTDATT